MNMNSNHDGINTDLRAHPDVFIPQVDIYEDGGESSYIDDNENRSNSGSVFERTNRILREQPAPTMSQSYGGDRFTSFLLREGDLSPVSRFGRLV